MSNSSVEEPAPEYRSKPADKNDPRWTGLIPRRVVAAMRRGTPQQQSRALIAFTIAAIIGAGIVVGLNLTVGRADPWRTIVFLGSYILVPGIGIAAYFTVLHLKVRGSDDPGIDTGQATTDD